MRLTDAGDGAGTWEVQLAPQSTSAGSSVDVPGTITIPPGGEADLPVVAHAGADAVDGEDYGFVVLRRGDVQRRVPYLFVVERPALVQQHAAELQKLQAGDTRFGADRVDRYRYPMAPFGNAPDQPPMEENGAERVYRTSLNRAAANIGVSILLQSAGARIDPFFLGSQDEDDVQGFAGTPVDVNELTFDFGLPIGAAGASFPRQQAFYVAVDSGREPFTGRRLAGRYVLNFWVDDVTPPSVRLLTTRVAAGRPTLVVRTTDRQAGVDPFSLVIGYRRVLIGAAAYDPVTGLALFPLPRQAPKLATGTVRAVIASSDFEEAKNVNTTGSNIMPNTRFKEVRIKVVSGPALSWILPEPDACVARQQRLVVSVSATRKLRSVRFVDGARTIGLDRGAGGGLAAITWTTKSARPGRHALEAVATDASGRSVSARRVVRVCR